MLKVEEVLNEDVKDLNEITNTVLLGDALELLRKLPNESIDMIMSDPPYGISYNSNRTDRNEAIKHDGFDEWTELMKAFLPEFKRVLKPSGVACVFCGGGGGKHPVSAYFALEVIKYMNLIRTVVWRKFNGLGYRYRPAYENIFVMSKDNKKYNFYDTTKKCVDLIEGINQKIPRSGDHPTIKPIAILEKFINIHSKEGDVILDPFAGHFTTAMACNNLNRNWISCDMVEEYCVAGEKKLTEQYEEQKTN